jgi:heme-degrading monooxygenase HmoA
MVSRHWHGVAKAACADAYADHLRQETLPGLRQLPGFVGASVLRRAVASGVEFLVITQWNSLEAIRAFAGADVQAAVVPAKVQDMMIEYDRIARHYELVD